MPLFVLWYSFAFSLFQQEYDAKRALLDETFALKEEAIQKFAGQKKAVENALEAASV
jgi:hypothetical protein